MKSRISRRSMLAAWLLGGSIASAIDAPREPAPRFYAKSLDGEKFTNDSIKDKVVLIQFWTTWCRYCRKDQPAVDELANEFGDRLVVLAVNMGESKRKVREYLEGSPRACKIILAEDTNLAAALGADSFPKYVVIDRRGGIAGVQDGAGGVEPLRDLVNKAGLR